MGHLRMVPKHVEPGFIQYQVENSESGSPPPASEAKSHLQVVMPGGTVVQISPEMSLRQVARLVNLLERGHGLG